MRKINKCLNGRLIDICKRTVQLEELNSKLYQYLPPSLQQHCHVGSFNLGCLVLVVSDPVWASELRYSIPELRDKLRKEAGIYQLSSVKIMMATPEISPVHNKKKDKPPAISAQSCDAILAASDQCTYTPLREALHQLARGKNL